MWELRECAATVEGDLVRGEQHVARNSTVVERRGGRNGLRPGGEPGQIPSMRRLREVLPKGVRESGRPPLPRPSDTSSYRAHVHCGISRR